jgi:uncharacterized protein (DUF433 family)
MTTVSVEHIEIVAGATGPTARIAGRGVKVRMVAVWHEWLGMSADEIADQYGLTLAEVHAALAYYHDHREEIDAQIRAGRELAEELRKRTPSKLKEKLGR